MKYIVLYGNIACLPSEAYIVNKSLKFNHNNAIEWPDFICYWTPELRDVDKKGDLGFHSSHQKKLSLLEEFIMSKNVTILVFVFCLTVMGAVGFLGFQITRLNTLYLMSQNLHQNAGTSESLLKDQLEGFSKELQAQKDSLSGLSVDLLTISKQVNEIAKQDFMPAPEMALTQQIYKIETASAENMEVIGNKVGLSDWRNRNDLFLDSITKKSLVLDFDRARGSVVVQDVAKDSIFGQMGILMGDHIVSIDGVPMTKGAIIREKLLDGKDRRVIVLRGNKKMVMNLTYQEVTIPDVNPIKSDDQVELSISKAQFDANLPKLLATVKMVPVMKEGQVVGTKISDFAPEDVFSLMNLKDQDVITRVNGDLMTNNKLSSALKSAGQLIKIEYLRDDKPGQVSVVFSK